MSLEETTRIARELLARMRAGADHDEIAALFSTDLDFEIAGVSRTEAVANATRRGLIRLLRRASANSVSNVE